MKREELEQKIADYKEKIVALEKELEQPEDAKKYILDLIYSLDVFLKRDIPQGIFFKKGNDIYFELNLKDSILWYSDTKIYQLLESKFNLNKQKINELFHSIIEDTFKIKGVTPCNNFYNCRMDIEDTFIIKGVTPLPFLP